MTTARARRCARVAAGILGVSVVAPLFALPQTTPEADAWHNSLCYVKDGVVHRAEPSDFPDEDAYQAFKRHKNATEVNPNDPCPTPSTPTTPPHTATPTVAPTHTATTTIPTTPPAGTPTRMPTADPTATGPAPTTTPPSTTPPATPPSNPTSTPPPAPPSPTSPPTHSTASPTLSNGSSPSSSSDRTLVPVCESLPGGFRVVWMERDGVKNTDPLRTVNKDAQGRPIEGFCPTPTPSPTATAPATPPATAPTASATPPSSPTPTTTTPTIAPPQEAYTAPPPTPEAEYTEFWVCRPNADAPMGFDFLRTQVLLEGDLVVVYEDDCAPPVQESEPFVVVPDAPVEDFSFIPNASGPGRG